MKHRGTSVQAVLVAPGSIGFRQEERTRLKSDRVRVRFLYCGLCGSDLSKFAGRRRLSYPVSLGHEFIGEVTQVGGAVDNITEGDLVTSDLNYRCGVCDQCRAKRSHLCREGRAGLFTTYAFADVGDLHASYLLPIDDVVASQLSLSEPLSCVLHAAEWAGLQPSDRVLVVGAGGLGLCMAFALCGRAAPMEFDIAEAMPSRLSLIEAAVAPTGRAIERPEGEYDVVFDLSGTEAGLRSACSHVKAGGRLCSMSHLDGSSDGAFLLSALTRRDVTFTVSYLNGERENLELAARLLQRNWNPSWNSLTEVVELADLQAAFERRPSSPWCKTIVRVADRTG